MSVILDSCGVLERPDLVVRCKPLASDKQASQSAQMEQTAINRFWPAWELPTLLSR